MKKRNLCLFLVLALCLCLGTMLVACDEPSVEQPPVEDPVPEEPETPEEPDNENEDSCPCNCHAGGIKAFFFKLINFFAKIFDKSARVCECGKSH